MTSVGPCESEAPPLRGAGLVPMRLQCLRRGVGIPPPPAAGEATDARSTLRRRTRLSPYPGPGETRDLRHQAAREPARSLSRLHPRRRRGVRRNRGRRRRGFATDRALESRRGGDERDRGARSGSDRTPGGEARHGRQGGAVQEVLRHRRVRHRGRRDRSGPFLRHRGEPRAHVRRHQPRGHQGAGMLRDRVPAARSDEHPRSPRRPARHRDHRGRGGAQRPRAGREVHRGRAARHLGGGCGGARLPGASARNGPETRERRRHRHRRRGSCRSRGADGPVEGTLRGGFRRAYPRRRHRRRGHLPRTLGPRRVEAGAREANGGESAHSRARQPGSGNPSRGRPQGPPGRHHRHRPFRLSQSGQQRPVLSVHLSRRARCRRDGHQPADEARVRRCARRTRPPGAVRPRHRGLRRGAVSIRSKDADSKAVRPAAAHRAGARRSRAPRCPREWRLVPSTISTPIANA